MFGEAALTLGKQARLLDLAHDAILVSWGERHDHLLESRCGGYVWLEQG